MCLLLGWAADEPAYHFDFSTIDADADIDRLLDTSHRLRQTREWNPWAKYGRKPEDVLWTSALATVISESPNAQGAIDLLRSTPDERESHRAESEADAAEHADAGTHGRIATHNEIVLLLSDQLTKTRLSELRRITDATKLEAALQQEMRLALQSRRRRSFQRVASDEQLRELLAVLTGTLVAALYRHEQKLTMLDTSSGDPAIAADLPAGATL